MDLISLYYFSELAKDLNMTKTAARLYISQQTLSNHIHRLEQYYNAPLFYRKPSLSLTCAGEFVLSFAQIVEKEHVNLKDILSDIEGQERGMLRVGASLARGVQFLPRILPDFCRRYPKVEVRFTDGLSSCLEEMIEHGELDFAIVLSKSRSPNLVEHDLLQDQVYLCVPESLLQTHYTPEEAAAIKARSRQGAQLQDFSRLPFSLLTNRLGTQLHDCFSRAKFQPVVFFTGTYTNQTLPLCAKGLTACYCTHMSLIENYHQVSEGINIFPLLDQGAPIFQSLTLIRHRQRYLTHFAKYFIDLLFQVTERLEQFQVTRIIDIPSPGGLELK